MSAGYLLLKETAEVPYCTVCAAHLLFIRLVSFTFIILVVLFLLLKFRVSLFSISLYIVLFQVLISASFLITRKYRLDF